MRVIIALALLVFAAQAQLPVCTWSCDTSNTCDAICHNVCQAPSCTVDCPTNITCSVETPSCSNNCPTPVNDTSSCPDCTVDCAPLPPQCVMDGCSINCMPANCTFACFQPACPYPTCTLSCADPGCPSGVGRLAASFVILLAVLAASL